MKSGFSPGVVVAVSLSAVHQFSKPVQKSIRLLVGLGVEGDAHLESLINSYMEQLSQVFRLQVLHDRTSC
jgi:hypothetical protein